VEGGAIVEVSTQSSDVGKRKKKVGVREADLGGGGSKPKKSEGGGEGLKSFISKK
jgi:hypothetical protein